MNDVQATRALLVRVCQSVGFAPPAPDRGLIAWADESLDAALAPRGGPAWQRAQAYVIDAFDAAQQGNETIATSCLRRAVAIVHDEGRRACVCAIPASPKDDGFGRARCARCFGRVTQPNKGDEPKPARSIP